MQATGVSQWLFPVSAVLDCTPSRTTSSIPVERELYDRARGVEFLYRLGVTLGLPSSALYTAATWFHRFYMRHSMEDYHRQDVAAACIFLATKTEECGRKLRDVAKVYLAKLTKKDAKDIPDDNKEVEEYQNAILLTEEVLLEALCFDFIVTSPHSDLVELFDARPTHEYVEEYAWSVANDSFRTPLCVLYSSRVTAAACYILAQHYVNDPEAMTLTDRISSPAPSTSLPTPPSHKPYTESARFALEFFRFNEIELASLSDALTILLQFYASPGLGGSVDYLSALNAISPPNPTDARVKHFMPSTTTTTNNQNGPSAQQQESPAESGGGDQHYGATSTKSPAKGWIPVKGNTENPLQRLDLS